MKRSRGKHHLVSRVSELFAGDDFDEFNDIISGTDVSLLVSDQLRKTVPKTDQKPRCSVLCGDKNGKQKRESADRGVSQTSSATSTQVIYESMSFESFA